MCFSKPDVKTPAAPQAIANLPPNVLQLGAGAKQQLSGGGTGLQALRIEKGSQAPELNKQTLQAEPDRGPIGNDNTPEFRKPKTLRELVIQGSKVKVKE